MELEKKEIEQLSKQILEITKSPRKEFGDRPIPKILYHYTDVTGVKGIIESQSLWATSINFLNDPDELVYGLDVIIDSIESSKLSKSFSTAMWALLDVSKKMILEGESETSNTYVISFCEEQEILGQWRLYGRNGLGYCLGIEFHPDLLLGAIPEDASIGNFGVVNFPKPILYNKDNQIKYLSKIFEAIDCFLLEFFDTTGVGKDSKRKFQIYTSIVHYTIDHLLPYIKKPEFNEEREWRIVVKQKSPNWKTHYRASGSLISPFIRLGFHQPTSEADDEGNFAYDQTEVPIREIIAGNCLEFPRAKMGLAMFLEHKGVSNVSIVQSPLKFR